MKTKPAYYLIACLLLGISGLLSACENAASNPQLVAISPAASAEIEPGNSIFKWASTGFGDYHVRILKASSGEVLADTVLAGTEFASGLTFQPGADYFWEIEQSGVKLVSAFRAKSTQQLIVGQHNGTWEKWVYSDPDLVVTNGVGDLSVTASGAGVVVELIGQTEPVYLEPGLPFGGIVYCRDTAGGYPHRFTDLAYDYAANTISFISRDGVGNASYKEWRFQSL
jgi:hypothetical protein